MPSKTIPTTALHPKPRLKYRLDRDGQLSQWEKVTVKKCLGWRPAAIPEGKDALCFTDPCACDLAAITNVEERAFTFHYLLAQPDHSLWNRQMLRDANVAYKWLLGIEQAYDAATQRGTIGQPKLDALIKELDEINAKYAALRRALGTLWAQHAALAPNLQAVCTRYA